MSKQLGTISVATAALAGLCGVAEAQDVTLQGFVRVEVAPKISDEENPFNQNGNLFNGRAALRDSTLLGGGADTVIRSEGGQADNDLNYFVLRSELDINASFSSKWTGYAKIRALFQPDVYDSYGDPNFYEVPFYNGDSSGTPLELSGENYMIDLPALYLDYADGPLWLRIGNQQIAWGESLFFRVLDVPNGLDYRRHLILDVVAEEFSDERIASPALRGSVRSGDWEYEAFVQMFNPSIIPNENTPYNIIPSQFVVRQEETFDNAAEKLNYGGRIQGQFGDLGVQFIAVHRKNPDGVYRWTKSGINRDIPGLTGSGFVLQDTPFEVSPQGVLSAEEWFTYAAMTRLDGTQALNRAVRDFPAAALLGAAEVGDSKLLAGQELDLFFQLSGGLRGHIERVFENETIVGMGANYILSASPGSWMDQLVLRGELTYTPDKAFTNINLGSDFIIEDEWVGSLVAEKYHRFSPNFPATFMVLQYLYKSESDLFGRHMSGTGGSVDNVPTGEDDFHAVAFAMQQPFPNLIWRADLSVLYDLNGGALIQPNLRWKPNEEFAIELFANVLVSDGGNDDIISTVDWADEIGLRITRQF